MPFKRGFRQVSVKIPILSPIIGIYGDYQREAVGILFFGQIKFSLSIRG